MRIAIDGRTIVKGKSGVGTYVERTVRALLQVDSRNEYFLFLVDPLDDLDAPNLTKVFIPGYQRAGRNRYWENFLFPTFAAHNGIDIFFGAAYALPMLPRWRSFMDFLPLPSRWKLPFNPGRRIKYIAGVLDMIGFVRPETFTPKMRMWQSIFVTNAVKIADAIITISESTKRDLLRLFPYDPSKVYVTHLSVDDAFRPDHKVSDVRRIKSRYGLPEQFILYVGTIEPRKNVAGIAKAFSRLPGEIRKQYPLIIAGSKGWYAEAILNEIDSLGIQDEIRLTGFVDSEDLPALMSMASLFVFPSLYEGFGYPVLEAMASGVPVITSTSSSLPEVIGEAGIAVDPENIEALSTGMRRVLTDPAVHARLKAKGLERAALFSWRKTAEQTLRVFETVMRDTGDE